VADTAKIVLVEDEPFQRQVIAECLAEHGLRPTALGSGEELKRLAQHAMPDLVLLDVHLNEPEDGFALARWLRSRSLRTGIIMLTAAGDTIDRVVGLESGADDYVAKPFEPRELVARIQAVLRRGNQEEMEIVRSGAVEVNFSTRSARVDGRELALTSAEFELLGFLVRNRGRVLSRDRIIEGTHGINWEAFDRSIDVLISRLRQKLGDDPRQPMFIRTVRGVGYSFVGETSG
jgi:two-component system phosphate regulon response regulator OmpR